EAALDLADQGFTEVAARGLSSHHQSAVMDLLGVEVARARQQHHHEKPATRPPGCPTGPSPRRSAADWPTRGGWCAAPSARSPWTGSGCTPTAKRCRARSGSTTPATVTS